MAKHTSSRMTLLALSLSSPCIAFAANGYFLHGFGAVNESLGGAATAGNRDDIVGSLYRNPANASIFEQSRFAISLGAIFPDVTTESSIDVLGLSGSSESSVHAIPLLNLGGVYQLGKGSTSYYIAVVSEAGLHIDMPASSTNPIFVPQAGSPDNPFGGLHGGFGAVESQLQLVRIPLGMSLVVDEKWSFGFAAAPSIARLKYTPATFDAPDDANGDGIPSYPTDVDHAISLGIGFQVGLRYQISEQVGLGLSVSTPAWFQAFEWDVTDEAGGRREVTFDMDRPLTVDLGLRFRPLPDTLVLLDWTWINYSNTTGFERTGMNADLSLKGLGWDDMSVISLGVQQRLNHALTIRAGYNHGRNPIAEDIAFYNLGSPLVVEHHLSLGASWQVTKQLAVDLGYTRALSNSISGPFYEAASGMAVSGTNVTEELEYDQISLGLSYRL